MDLTLDDDERTIAKNLSKINGWLRDIAATDVSVIEVRPQRKVTLFVLSVESLHYEKQIIQMLATRRNRFSLCTTQVTINLVSQQNDDPDHISKYIGRIPTEMETFAIERKAFVALPRPIVMTLVVKIVLVAMLGLFIYTLYRVLL